MSDDRHTIELTDDDVFALIVAYKNAEFADDAYALRKILEKADPDTFLTADPWNDLMTSETKRR